MIAFTEDCDRDLKWKEAAASVALWSGAGAGKEREAGSSERRVPLARLIPMESTAVSRPAAAGKKRKQASTADDAGKKRKAATADAGKKRKAATADAEKKMKEAVDALKEGKKEGDSSLFKEEGDILFKEGEMLRLWEEYWEAVLLWGEKLVPGASSRWLERKKTTPVAGNKKKKKKKKKVIRVSVPDDYIDHIIKNPTMMKELSEDEMADCPEDYRQSYAISKIFNAKNHAYHQALVDQYHAFGYAYSEKEVTDEDEKDTDDDEKEVTDKEVVVAKNY